MKIKLQNEMIYTQKQPGHKKGVALFKMVSVKKLWNQGGSQKMAGWWQNFNNNNSGCLIPASLGFSTKFTWIIVIKNFATSLYHHRQFLAAPLISPTFFTLAIFNRVILFSVGLFLSRYYRFCNLASIFVFTGYSWTRVFDSS